MNMKIGKITIILFAFILQAQSYVDDFTRIEADPFVEAQGGVYVAQRNLFTVSAHNPASRSANGFFLAHSSMFDGMVNVDHLAYNRQLNDKFSGGLGILYAYGDAIPVTALPDPEDTVGSNNKPYIVEEKSHHDVLAMPSISMKIKDGLYGGATLNLFYRKHIDESAIGASVSAGLFAELGKRLNAGLHVRNLSTMPVSWSTGTTELALPSVRGGLSYDIAQSSTFNFAILADTEYNLGSEYFDWGLGVNARFSEMVQLMAGYSDNGFAAGAGIFYRSFGLGMSFTTQDKLDQSYRIALTYGI